MLHWIYHLRIGKMLLSVFAVILLWSQDTYSQFPNQAACDQSSCYPATGDLLIGRERNLTSTSTCGLLRRDRFCIISHLEDREKKCFVCDSRDYHSTEYSHRIENIISTFRGVWRQRWWQAENGLQDVSIQLDLEAEFHFTHLVMRFKTFRPAAMLIERSYDFGKTWRVYRYFAYDCASSFPGVITGPIRRITDVICESRYSDVEPSTEGEVIFRVLPPNIEIEDPYSEEVQGLLKMTNLRVNFTKLHTLGDNLLDNRYEIKEKYYYALYDMVVRGMCSCYGHASRCVPADSTQALNANMVYGQCECTHNTKGRNCEQCEDFYNDKPWGPARGRETNACQKCNCNNHADRCHFDSAVYEATGRISGGVCDECRHNTKGRNCEECKPFFYRDPRLTINHPEVCRACECDPIGSEHGGECESHTDPDNDLVAGRCICKRFLEGPRCDTCQDGYWNMRADNPEGCEACSCSTIGTFGNYGCDKRTGECRCKRYVTGRSCDQCLPGYWGMSEDPNGCKPCDCDVGGAYDNNCDQSTGQCRCKPNVIGRQCNKAAPGFFTTDLDYLRYEGEFATGIGNTRVVIREPTQGRDVTWTGPGFMRVSEGDSLEFDINNIIHSMEYDIVIRYEPQMPERWDDMRVTVIRPGSVDQSGPCANSMPQDDYKTASLPQVQGLAYKGDDGSGDDENLIQDEGFLGGPRQDYVEYYDKDGNLVEERHYRGVFEPTGQRYFVVLPSSCLEKGVNYKIRLEFSRFRGNRVTPEASVLIDSIILIPNTDSISIFQGLGIPQRMKEEFVHYRCADQHLTTSRQPPPDVCKGHMFSISTSMNNMALDCDCDPTGSESAVCNPYGGQCPCKPNVIGRRCDQCAPGTYGFGPAGCIACNCDAIGARDNFCDVQTGQCLCIPNAFGRECGECQRGFWGFPSCRLCDCNGRAETCENEDGRCHDCGANTGGHHCQRCANGYYGDPRPGSLIGCRECMCPGGLESGYSHADTCNFDARSQIVTCNCQPGYTGPSCERCAENYYGNPLIPGGTCEPCTCNGNIDINIPGSCDASTGECLKCQFFTQGFSCEQCTPGYYGDATQQNCQACVCNLLGTDRDAGPCDPQTGQCPCLPNVIGQRCDRCAPDYWKIASGRGCESCSCDPDGSESTQCNEFDGQCRCRAGRGGRDCSECEDYHWGDPNSRCQHCDCNQDGSAVQQCDRRTGACVCQEGVTGYKCDRCARGTTGALPFCMPCGECFDNWDRIIMELKNETDMLIKEGSDIKVEGAPSAFDKEFKDMEDMLEDVRKILSGTNVTEKDLDELRDQLQQIRSNLTTSTDDLDTLEIDVDDTNNRIEEARIKIDSIKSRVDNLKKAAEILKANATSIRESDVSGAFNSSRESQRRSRDAQRRVDQSSGTVQDSEDIRRETEDLMDSRKDEFNDKVQENEDRLTDLSDRVAEIDERIVDLNELVCDGRGDPCDSLCGGAGCGKCGGLSCEDGAVTKANNALDLSKGADKLLMEKKTQAEKLLNDVNSAQDLANMAKADAKMAHDMALNAKEESENTRDDLQTLIDKITEFLTIQGARPTDIRDVAEEVLEMSISLTPQEIRELAKQINQTIQGLTDIDAILDATRDDLANAQDLKIRADNAKKAADEVLSTAQEVVELLEKAKVAQDAAEDAITDANRDITDAEGDLTMIESETSAAESTASDALTNVENLKDRLVNLKNKFTENEMKVNRASDEASIAEELANEAEQDAQKLEEEYQDVSSQLEEKYNSTRVVKERADALRDRAATLYQDIYKKKQDLDGLDAEFSRNERNLIGISDEIAMMNEKMNDLLASIIEVAKYHRTCI